MGSDQTVIRDMSRALETNSTNTTAFAVVPPTTTEPTGDGVHVVPQTGGNGRIIFMPYLTDADNETLSVRLLLWERFDGLWMARTSIIVSCIANSGLNGVSGADLSDLEFLCDSITFTAGDESAIIPAVGVNNLAWVDVNLDGAKKIEFEFDRGTAATGNALFRFH